MLWIWFSLLAVLVADESALRTPLANPIDVDQTVLQLAEQLGDESFAVRQRAMYQLWLRGGAAKPVLQQYAKVRDAETAARAARVLEHLEYGIKPDMEADLADAIYSFHKGGPDLRLAILIELREAGQHKLVLDLIASAEKQPDRADMVDEIYPDTEELLERVLLTEPADSTLLDVLFEHPVMWEFRPADSAVYANISGQLPDKIARLQESLKQDSGDTRFRLNLIWLLRSAGQVDRAIEVAQQLPQGQNQIVKRLMIEQGNWRELSRRAALVDSQTLAQHAERLFFTYWSGDQIGQRQAHADLAEKFRDDSYADSLANVHLTTLDTDWILSNASRLNQTFAFRLLCYMHRFEEAFALVGAPAVKEKKLDWYREQIRRLSTRIRRSDASNYREANDLFELCRLFAFYTGMLGKIDESLEMHELLIKAISTERGFFQGWNERLFSQLVDLELGEDIWRYYEVLKQVDGVTQNAAELFPDAWEQATLWNEVLKDEIPSAVQRNRFICSLTRSPCGDPQEDFEIEYLYSLARPSIDQKSYRQRSRQLVSLAKTLEIHDRHALAADALTEAGYLGNLEGFEMLARAAFKEQRWREAVDWFEQAHATRPDSSLLYSQSQAEKNLQNLQLAAGHKNKALLLSLHSYHLTVMAQAAEVLGNSDDAIDFLMLYVRGADLESNDEYFFHERLGALFKETHPEKSLDCWKRATLAFYKYMEATEVPNLRFHYLATETHFAQARTLLANGEVESAMQLLRRCAQFVSANSELAEEFVPKLEQAQRLAEAEELFALVADRYLRILKQYPASAMHHNNYAWVCARCDRRLQDGLAHSMRAVQLKPNNTSYLDTLAEINYRLGNQAAAIAHSEKCIRLNPYKEHYREQLARFSAAAQRD